MAAPRTLLLTRPERQAAEFAAALEAAAPGRFRAIAAPVIGIVPVDAPLGLDDATGLIFTSANGVEQFARRSDRRDLPAYCVGEMTAAAARDAGLTARSADGDVAALAELVAATHGDAGPLVHVRGRHAAGDLAAQLASAGIAVRGAGIYDQVPLAIGGEAARLLAAGKADAVAVFSPRSARIFAAACRDHGWDLSATVTAALSPAADSELGCLRPAARVVAARPTREAMIAALKSA